jgi:hypothetical protein
MSAIVISMHRHPVDYAQDRPDPATEARASVSSRNTNPVGETMKTRKIWVGVGTAILAAPPAVSAMPAVLAPQTLHASAQTEPRQPRFLLAQHADHGAVAPAAKAGGTGEGEGGGKADANLPPILVFYRGIELIRGHLLVGNELVAAGRWGDALPHFLHPTEEIYGNLRNELKTYDVPPFETALKALAQTIKAKNKDAYGRALATVNERLEAAERGVKAKTPDAWAPFVLETALETLKIAADEYGNAIDGNRIKLPVEYQDSRGFVLEAERVVEGVSGELGSKDAQALAAIRAAFVDLKKAWPAPMPPRAPVKDVAEVLSDMSRIELQLGRFR